MFDEKGKSTAEGFRFDFAFFLMGACMQKVKNPPTEVGTLKKGVLLLTVANLLVKVLGFVYKVPLNHLLGDEMASVNAATALFAVLYTASTAGIPGALSLSVSRARAVGDGKRIKRIFDATLALLLGVGLFLSLLIAFLARPLSLLQSDSAGFLCTLAIAPALFFTAATSVLRGFFQGFSNLIPTAVSELLEALGKAVFGVLLATLAVTVFGRSASSAAALAVFGITLGIMLGTLSLTLRYRREGRRLLSSVPVSGGKDIRAGAALRAVVLLSLPITLSAALMSTGSFIDAQMMRPLLERVLGDAALAKSLYSDYSTGALTLYNLPAVLVMPLSTALIPYISGAIASGREQRARRVTETALKLSSLISLPAALGLSVLSGPILSFVFRSDTDMAENAGPLLSVLAFCVFFSALLSVSSAALQAFKREKVPMLSLGVGVLVKLLTISPLVLRFGAVGVPLSTLLFFAVSATVNLVALCRTASLRPRVWDALLRPSLCALLSALSAHFTHRGLLPHLGADGALLLAILLAVLVYFSALLLLRAVGREELSMLPFVGKYFQNRENQGRKASL